MLLLLLLLLCDDLTADGLLELLLEELRGDTEELRELLVGWLCERTVALRFELLLLGVLTLEERLVLLVRGVLTLDERLVLVLRGRSTALLSDCELRVDSFTVPALELVLWRVGCTELPRPVAEEERSLVPETLLVVDVLLLLTALSFVPLRVVASLLTDREEALLSLDTSGRYTLTALSLT